jgi:hypothetical protein
VYTPKLRSVSIRDNIERSIEFVIKVGAGTEVVGLFESIHLLNKSIRIKLCYKMLSLQLNKGPVCA